MKVKLLPLALGDAGWAQDCPSEKFVKLIVLHKVDFA